MRGGGRARDAAILAPLGALALLCPPLIGLAAGAGTAALLLYLGIVWIGMILAAFLIARRLGQD